ATGKENQRLKGYRGGDHCMAFAPDGKTLATGGDDWKIRLWDVATGESVHPVTGHLGLIDSLAFTADGKTLASGSWDGTARLWNTETGKEMHRLEENKEAMDALAWSPDYRTIITSSAGLIRLSQGATGRQLRTFRVASHAIKSACFTPDGKR